MINIIFKIESDTHFGSFFYIFEIFLPEFSPNTSSLHPTNKKMTHVINFKKSVILIKEMEE